jgi:AcrR family transcriptional regulator
MNEKLPAGLDTLWGRRARAVREPKPGLSVDRIVQAAVELADADGLEAVSMSRVANRLGFTTMSLYRHVASKDELLVLMLDAALGPPPPLDASAVGWRARLKRWCIDMLAVLNRHPWWLRIPISPPPPTPSSVAWLDRGLSAMEDTRLEEAEKAAIVLMLNGIVFWEGRLTAELGRPVEGARDPLSVYTTVMSDAADAERFPALHRAIEAGIFADESRDTDFSFTLARVLDGVEQLVAAREEAPA